MRYSFIFVLLISLSSHAQQTADVEDFKKEVLTLRAEVQNIQVNLAKGQQKFKRGILVATIGYSVTIAGGLMLGRKHDELGKGLLIAGGATGIIGTAMMLDAFKFLGRPLREKQRS